MWLTGLDRKRRFVNKAYVEFLGIDYAAAVDFDWRTILHPDDHDRIVTESIRGEASLKPFTLEACYRGGDGAWHWLRSVSQPLFEADGEHLGFVGVAFDLSEAKAAQDHLRDAEERLRLATDSAGIGTWDWDLTRLTGTWSDQAQRILGLDHGEDVPLAQRMEAVVPEDRALLLAHVGERVREGGDLDIEYRIQRPGGQVRWVSSRGTFLRDPSGRAVRALGTLRDITTRRNAQARLEELNRTLETEVAARTQERDAMWRLSRDLLLVLDPRLRILAVNPIVEELTGYSQEEALGGRLAGFIHPLDWPTVVEAVRQGRRERVRDVEARLVTRDGEVRWFVWNATPEAGRAYVSGRDVTEERARMAELLAAQEALRQSQKLEAIGQLTGGVAHDFNNLLSPIIGGLDILKRRGVGGEREQRLIEGALQSADRARLLVQRLLAFARRQPLQVSAVALAPLVDELSGLLASTLGPRIELATEVPSDLPPVVADPNQLEMAILNLTVNARDAMPDGGRLSLSARLNDDGDEDGPFVELSVADTGVGMDEETLARATEPFFSSKGIGQGTGLGLSMVEGLTAQLGGSLAISSRQGAGTTVTLRLPAAARPAAEPKLAEALPRGTARGRVLLVDDEPLVRLSTADALADEGFAVAEAASGEEALALLAADPEFDCVVTDYLMPGLNGVDLARRLREHYPRLPVMLLSGYAELDGFGSELPYLAKPALTEALTRMIAELIEPVDDAA